MLTQESDDLRGLIESVRELQKDLADLQKMLEDIRIRTSGANQPVKTERRIEGVS